MNPIPFSALRKCFLFLVSGVLLSNPQILKSDVQSVQAAATDTVCRFGITSLSGSNAYDIAGIGVGSYLDWGAGSNPSLPSGVEYIRVLRVRDDLFPQTRDSLPAWVGANPGGVWVVGNEPDTTYGSQDALTPEVYADRYYQLATIIRNMDPSARIAFGSVVQPSPIRLRYLERAWNQLVADAGSSAAASALIDFWSIHSFILNEEEYSWGTGIPPGFEHDHSDAVIITDFTDTYSSDIFQERILAFRIWMASIGERGKPLWITEYGSLFPPIDPPGGPDYVNVSDQDTANFMLATFDFMLSATDDQTGLPSDGNRLVQRWFWYSLNDHRYNFGGSIFDPDNRKMLTWVGQVFRDYQSLSLAQPDLFPVSLSIAPISYSHNRTLVNYRLDLTIGNALSADTGSSAQVWIYDGNPEAGGTLIIGPIASNAIQRCGGTAMVSAYWMAVQPLTQHNLNVLVTPIGVSDINPGNNRASFSVYTDLPKLNFLPNIYR
jgi:hypothetical protein